MTCERSLFSWNVTRRRPMQPVGIGEMLSGGNEAVGLHVPSHSPTEKGPCFSRIDPFVCPRTAHREVFHDEKSNL
jgi:hypothetical protein